jgi:hypothetical protein
VRLLPRRGPKREPLIRPEDILLSKRITWRIDEPFTIFECRDFLPNSIYEELSRSFPDELLGSRIDEDALQVRLTNVSGDAAWRSFIRENPIWHDLVNSMSSRQFISDALRVFEGPIHHRATMPDHHWTWRLLRRQFVRSWWNYVSDFDINLSLGGYYLSPHTDSGKKVLALMFYFPRPDQTDFETLAGTGFFRARFAQPVSAHGPSRITRRTDERRWHEEGNGEREARFLAEYERFHVSRFRANHVAGFIKSGESWRDCDLRPLPISERRRVMLFNINLRQIGQAMRRTSSLRSRRRDVIEGVAS